MPVRLNKPSPTAALLEALEGASSAEGTKWLRERIAALTGSTDPAPALGVASAMARRKLGDRPLGSGSAAIGTQSVPVAHWPAGDAARAAMLLALSDSHPDGARALVETGFDQGDESERAAIARALALFPFAAALKPLALAAGRANSLSLFSAIALDNPYPASHYTDQEFNQLVLKSLFNALPIARITGLAERANPELSRMCEDYVGERSAAGRTIPTDIWLALVPHASATGEALAITHLAHADRLHRYHAALGLSRRAHEHPSLRAELTARLAIEDDQAVAAVLRAAAG